MAKDVLSINKTVLKDNGVNLTEFMFMMMLLYQPGLTCSYDCSNLLSYGYIEESDIGLSLTQEGLNFIKKVEINSIDAKMSLQSIKTLALQMRDLYPEGKKPGTNKYWRGNNPEVTKKLISFFKDFGQYDPELMLEATRKYVKSFSGESQLMRILPYFILKDGNSELMTYIENIDNISDNKNDDLWSTTLI